MNSLRTRWAAIGAAVAVTLGAGGGLSLVSASVGSGERTVLVTITPCRLADTRPSFQVGPRSTRIGENKTHTIQARGTNGRCTIPYDAVALSMNVTATGATKSTFLTIWETGMPRPGSASLNPAPGQPPTPNAVVTALSPTGQFNVFNREGNVDVVVDVNGYYVDHHHDDRYARKLSTYTGQIAVRYYAGTGFALAQGSFPRPLPPNAPIPVLEFVTGTSSNCPGTGVVATPGVLCVYGYNPQNVSSVILSGGSDGPNRQFGFSLDVNPSDASADGFLIASWAYRLP